MNLEEGTRNRYLCDIFILKDKGTPIVSKYFDSCTVVYVLSLINFIPNFIYVLGYLDYVILRGTENLNLWRGIVMTTIYFVRHAEPNYNNHDDMLRELSSKGLKDRKLVTDFLTDKQIDVVLSSPYKRAVETVRDFAEKTGKDILVVEDFKERRVDSEWIEDFESFCKKQWEDFDYKLSDGECLKEVQSRNILALDKVLTSYKGKNIVVGSHGTALSTIINYYDKSFGYFEFDKIRFLMPWIVEFTFKDKECVNIQKYNLFEH